MALGTRQGPGGGLGAHCEVISVALHGVDGVLADKPVEVFLLEFGDSAYHLSVRWWIESYRSEFAMLDKGNSVIKASLRKAGIDIPFKAYDLNLNRDDEVDYPIN